MKNKTTYHNKTPTTCKCPRCGQLAFIYYSGFKHKVDCPTCHFFITLEALQDYIKTNKTN